jgi:WD40 repeat protein
VRERVRERDRDRDREREIWDLASGQLRLTLTGHIEQVTGLAVSSRHPYMFSCGLDKMVKCWDLEYNKVRTTSLSHASARHLRIGLERGEMLWI